jgi:hypothetical protein
MLQEEEEIFQCEEFNLRVLSDWNENTRNYTINQKYVYSTFLLSLYKNVSYTFSI